jgi:mono/diheme cytochrome c family protein
VPALSPLVLIACLVVLSTGLAGCRADEKPTAQPTSESASVEIQATAKPASAAGDGAVRGAEIFARQCAACHGPSGNGDGAAAYLLYPKPRDFRGCVFRYTSTWEGTPTDEDLFRIISRGMPGSAMPSWAHLPAADRHALVAHVKSLCEKPLALKPVKAPDPEFGEPGEGPVELAPEPADDGTSRARGAELFSQSCASCHGERGQGDGILVASLRDASDYPIRPRDLTTGVFKGPAEPADLYRRIVAGIPDTPMPANPHLTGADAWHIVHFVRSLSSDVLRERAEMKRLRIDAARVDALPDHPDSGTWSEVPSVDLHMMPLWWRYNRPEYVTVQAAHDGTSIALLLVWADDTNDVMVVRPQDFRDAAAVQFSLDSDPPFFAMGEKGSFVNIWMWKSERQADLASFGDIDEQYPDAGIDSYPNLRASPYEQPMRHALTLESDPTFVTGWGAGNIVSDPTRRSAAEDLTAQGFGTLRARPSPDQRVESHGVYGTGSYRVMLKRALEGNGEHSIELRPGSSVAVAFAVWNGAAGDRDGKKSVTIWQDLVLGP